MVFGTTSSLRLQTLYLVAEFLKNEKLDSTLSSLQHEAKELFQELETEILPHHLPLMAIVEQSNMEYLQRKLKSLQAENVIENLVHEDDFDENSESNQLDVSKFDSYDSYKNAQESSEKQGIITIPTIIEDNTEHEEIRNYRRTILSNNTQIETIYKNADESSSNPIIHHDHGFLKEEKLIALQKEEENNIVLLNGTPLKVTQARVNKVCDDKTLKISPSQGIGNVICTKIINSIEPESFSSVLLSNTSKYIELLEIPSNKIDTGSVNSTLLYQAPSIILDIDHYYDWVAFACMDGSLFIGKLNQIERKFVKLSDSTSFYSFKDHSKYVTRVRFSSNGKYIITGSYDKTVNIYQCKFLESNDSLKNKRGPDSMEIERIHSINFKGEVESLCTTTIKLVNESEGNILLDFVIVGTRNDCCLHYINLDPKKGFIEQSLNMNEDNDKWVSFAPMDLVVIDTNPFINSSKRLNYNSNKYLLCYTDSKAGRLIVFQLGTNKHVRDIYGVSVNGLSNPRLTVDILGKYIFATSEDNSICVFDFKSGRLIEKLKGHSGIIRDVDFGHTVDGNMLITGSFDGSLRTWVY